MIRQKTQMHKSRHKHLTTRWTRWSSRDPWNKTRSAN